MMKTDAGRPCETEASCDEAVTVGATPFNVVRLRLLMKEREDAVNRLVELDYAIWNLEELFRAGTPE